MNKVKVGIVIGLLLSLSTSHYVFASSQTFTNKITILEPSISFDVKLEIPEIAEVNSLYRNTDGMLGTINGITVENSGDVPINYSIKVESNDLTLVPNFPTNANELGILFRQFDEEMNQEMEEDYNGDFSEMFEEIQMEFHILEGHLREFFGSAEEYLTNMQSIDTLETGEIDRSVILSFIGPKTLPGEYSYTYTIIVESVMN